MWRGRRVCGFDQRRALGRLCLSQRGWQRQQGVHIVGLRVLGCALYGGCCRLRHCVCHHARRRCCQRSLGVGVSFAGLLVLAPAKQTLQKARPLFLGLAQGRECAALQATQLAQQRGQFT
ncbi:hypothetical protein D3C80_1451230 [compost metagenome]